MTISGPVAIAGGGIAGLTAGLCLAQRGFDVAIIEQAAVIGAAGAGIQISPNASRILFALGLEDAISAVWTEPEAIILRGATTLKTIATVPAGAFARARWGAPYGVLSRSSLQAALLAAVRKQPRCRVITGHHVASSDPSMIARITGRIPVVVVGADGVRSAMREALPGGGHARFSGYTAWRFLIDQRRAPTVFDPNCVTAFVGPSAHLVIYPLRETGGFTVVAITRGKNQETTSEFPAKAFKSWHHSLLSIFKDETGRWPLHAVGDGAWHDGRSTVLIGDAAHAMLPFAAQGAAMAIEDGYELALRLSDSATVPDAFEAYVHRRKPRIESVRRRTAFNRFAYHARGPFRVGRDIVLSLRRPEALAADFDWLYGYEADR